MGKYIFKRILISLPVLWGISIIAFFIVRLVPGDTVTTMLGAHYNEEQASILRAKYGLDQPLVLQYLIWMGNVLKGDLGQSTFTSQPVLSAILERLPVTLELTILSLLYAMLVGIPLGVLAAIKHNSSLDYGASFLGMLGVSVPTFWLGTLMILLLSLKLGWLPSGGFVHLTEDPLGNLKRMLMPMIAMGTTVAAVVIRMTRSAMLEVLSQEFIKMAQAKGVSSWLLIWKHAFKNALIPVITALGIQAGYLLGGSVVIEQIFSLPGIGLLALQAINNRDYALLQGTILFIASSFVLINLMVDIIYAFLNPKIRY